jgi:signal transduction histidine kinase
MRRRLVVVFAAVTTMVAIAFVVPLALLVRNVSRDRALDDADRDARAVFPVLAVTDRSDDLAVAISRTRAGSAGRLSVYRADETAAGAPIAPSARVTAALADGRAWTGSVAGGAEVIAPVVRGNGDLVVVRVFVPTAELRRGVRAAWLALAGVGVALIVVSVLLADRLARSVTRPVTALSDASHRLGSGDLAVRVDPAGPPEVAAVGTAFNLLAQRVQGLLHAEREEVADLAHRLRTPLTALRLQVDQVDDSVLRDQLGRSADQLARALDGLIAEARRTARVDSPVTADLRAVVVERAGFWQVLADEQDRATQLDVPNGSVFVAVGGAELAAALDVLLENVFVHTPDGSGYRVSLEHDGAHAQVAIDDDGPGLPHGDVVGRGESGAASSGLGLDIARRTAEQAGGRLLIQAGQAGGAHVALVFPTIHGRA